MRTAIALLFILVTAAPAFACEAWMMLVEDQERQDQLERDADRWRGTAVDPWEPSVAFEPASTPAVVSVPVAVVAAPLVVETPARHVPEVPTRDTALGVFLLACAMARLARPVVRGR